MKLAGLKVLGVLVGVVVFAALPARADSLQIKVIDGAKTYTASSSSDGLIVDLLDADFGGSLDFVAASSNGTAGPAELTLTMLVDSLKGSTIKPNTLTIEVTDTGFLSPVGPTFLTQTLNTDVPVTGGAKGSATAQGFYNGDNTAFDVSGPSTPKSSENPFPTGTDAGLQGTSVITFGGGGFELTDIVNLSFTNPNSKNVDDTVSATLSSVAVPEPASVVLTGIVLLFTAGVLRRRYRRA